MTDRSPVLDARGWAPTVAHPGAADVDELEAGVRARDRARIARAITLVESTRADDQVLAQELLARLLPRAGGARRVGITGVPGVGKSTFIDALGTQLTARRPPRRRARHRPQLERTGGSILGDKTRMPRLAVDDARVHPPVAQRRRARRRRPARRARRWWSCEAAGFDVVLVETVGVGQSETAVADMVDIFLFLMLPGTGDELQGIKKGVLELADVIAVNKADGNHRRDAEGAAAELATVLHLMAPVDGWSAPVLTCSAVEGERLDEVWAQVEAHRAHLDRRGALAAKRRRQDVAWMWAAVEDQVLARFKADVAERGAELERDVAAGVITPTRAAMALLGDET